MPMLAWTQEAGRWITNHDGPYRALLSKQFKKLITELKNM